MVNDALLDSWERTLLARGRSEATILSYRNDLTYLANWMAEHDLGDLTTATKRDLEQFLADCRRRGLAAATVARRYRSMLQFYKWAVDEEEVDVSPVAKMAKPTVPVNPPPVIQPETFDKLLKACATHRQRIARPQVRPGRLSFEAKRDVALVLLLASTGIRSSEAMGLAMTDVDMRTSTIEVTGKGSKRRIVALMPRVAEALDRYQRARARHPDRAMPWFWLGERGRFTTSGLRQMLERRCADAGIDAINPHLFRHTFAHEAKRRGMSDGDLMLIAGWSSPQMLDRYGKSAAAERAREAHHRLFADM